jgi:hypothetical protein
MAIKMASKVGTYCIIVVFIVALVAAGATRREYLPDGGVQWLLLKPWTCCIKRCAPYRIGAPPWQSKWPVDEVHLFATAAYFDCYNRS